MIHTLIDLIKVLLKIEIRTILSSFQINSIKIYLNYGICQVMMKMSSLIQIIGSVNLSTSVGHMSFLHEFWGFASICFQHVKFREVHFILMCVSQLYIPIKQCLGTSCMMALSLEDNGIYILLSACSRKGLPHYVWVRESIKIKVISTWLSVITLQTNKEEETAHEDYTTMRKQQLCWEKYIP